MVKKDTEFGDDPSSVKSSWKKEFYKQLGSELGVTQLTPDLPTAAEVNRKELLDFPRWDVVQFTPDKSIPKQSVILYGNDALLPLQYSLVTAFAKMLTWIQDGSGYEGNALTRRAGNPLVRLFFEEDKPEDVASKDFIPVQGTISWRLMDSLEYENDLGKSVLTWERIEELAKSIYEEFQKPNDKDGYLWNKGKISYNYSDWNKGYGLKILCNKEDVGKEILDKILRINGHAFDSVKASVTRPKSQADYREGREIKILGKKKKKARFRPTATVRFKSAKMELSKSSKEIQLLAQGMTWFFPQDV